jgi:hypothetical protein
MVVENVAHIEPLKMQSNKCVYEVKYLLINSYFYSDIIKKSGN